MFTRKMRFITSMVVVTEVSNSGWLTVDFSPNDLFSEPGGKGKLRGGIGEVRARSRAFLSSKMQNSTTNANNHRPPTNLNNDAERGEDGERVN